MRGNYNTLRSIDIVTKLTYQIVMLNDIFFSWDFRLILERFSSKEILNHQPRNPSHVGNSSFFLMLTISQERRSLSFDQVSTH